MAVSELHAYIKDFTVKTFLECDLKIFFIGSNNYKRNAFRLAVIEKFEHGRFMKFNIYSLLNSFAAVINIHNFHVTRC